MLSEFWGYLPDLFYGYGIFFKKIKGILWDTGTPLPGPHWYQQYLKEDRLKDICY